MTIGQTQRSVLDRWLRLKYPEQFSADVQAQVQRHYEENLRKAGLTDEAANLGVSVEELIDTKAQAAFERMIRDYDTTLIEALEITPAALVAMMKREGEKVRGGFTRPAHLTNALDKALGAFFEIDKQGGTFTDAINQALIATEDEPYPPSRVTIRNWLREIAGGPWTTIPRPCRGRPKKENS